MSSLDFALDHFYDSGIYAHAFNFASASLSNHEILLSDGDPLAEGPASFDASYSPAWSQAGRCGYLREAIFPLGFDVVGSLSVRDGSGDYPSLAPADAPVECHDGSMFEFAANPTARSCASTARPTRVASSRAS